MGGCNPSQKQVYVFPTTQLRTCLTANQKLLRRNEPVKAKADPASYSDCLYSYVYYLYMLYI